MVDDAIAAPQDNGDLQALGAHLEHIRIYEANILEAEHRSLQDMQYESGSYKQKQARNRRQSAQYRAIGCAKRSLRLRFPESPSNSAAIKTKNQLNRSEGTQVMDV